jgi:hypothetical protein
MWCVTNLAVTKSSAPSFRYKRTSKLLRFIPVIEYDMSEASVCRLGLCFELFLDLSLFHE